MIEFNKGLDGFFHSLIPTELRENLKMNTAEYVRVRALTAMLLISTLVPVVTTLVIGGHHFFYNPDLLEYDTVSLGIALLLILQTGLFYRFNHHWLSGLAFTNSYFLLVAILLILSGGYASPMKAILLTCPIISFLIGGRQEGLQNSAMTLLFILGLTSLHAIEFDLPNVFSAENPQMIFVVNWIGSVAVIAVCIIVYETELQNRSERLPARRDPTRQTVSELSKRFEIFVQELIPQKLRTTLAANTMVYTRVQILSVMLALGCAASLLSVILLAGLHSLFHPEQLKYDWSLVVITFMFALQLRAFYKFNNYELSSLTLGYFYFTTILILIIISGGYGAPVMSLLLISPLVFFMLRGIQSGIRNAVFVAIIGATFGYLKHAGIELPNVFQATGQPIIFGIAWSISIVSIAACMAVYDMELEGTA